MGLKDYIKQKKEQVDAYVQKKNLDAEAKRQTARLQEKLDREALAIEVKNARAELRAAKQEAADRKALNEFKEYEKKKKFDNSFVGKFSAGLNSVADKADKISGASNNILGGGDMFGGSGIGGDLFSPKKKSGKKRKNNDNIFNF